ncbi:MAG: terpene cyclase/mutase family protein [Pirellulaceae bacterium]|nr:terpene cyclase/mutase family protein [Pirellulaceae bacterium]
MQKQFVIGLLLGIVFALSTNTLAAQESSTPFDAKKYREVVARGVAFLKQKGQDRNDGSFSKQVSPGVTALCAYALLKNGVPATDPSVTKALTYIEQFIKEDGGIYVTDGLTNYETSIALLAFAAANKDGKYDQVISRAATYLKRIQWDEEEGHGPDSSFYGGQGYGKSKRPDMSNTSFFVDALVAAGEDPDSTTMQKVRTFLSRSQNLPSVDNLEEYAANVHPEDRGGFIYSPANGGESKAPPRPDGGLRSYGSMTYAGLKSFLYAGVDKEDVRVQAALDWIRRHYDLKSNPGMGEQGLYYYYHVFAKALHAMGQEELVDSQNVSRRWKVELLDELASRQQPDGSWINGAEERWYEGDPNLATAYALMALVYIQPEEK